ncbi:MAG: YaaL family protein [Bacillota bacterium]
MILGEWLRNTWQGLVNGTPALSPAPEDPEKERIFRETEEARREWVHSRAYFNLVTEPELIDHAIYTIEAAEKKYIYLLRQIKEKYPELKDRCG